MGHEVASDESISEAVILAVSDFEGRDPSSLRPLSDVLDPDALDAIFRPQAADVPRTGGSLSFIYSNSRVTVQNGEYFTLQPIGPYFCNDRSSLASSHG